MHRRLHYSLRLEARVDFLLLALTEHARRPKDLDRTTTSTNLAAANATMLGSGLLSIDARTLNHNEGFYRTAISSNHFNSNRTVEDFGGNSADLQRDLRKVISHPDGIFPVDHLLKEKVRTTAVPLRWSLGRC